MLTLLSHGPEVACLTDFRRLKHYCIGDWELPIMQLDKANFVSLGAYYLDCNGRLERDLND